MFIPSRPPQPGAFDVKPKANRLHDGREIPFIGEARLAAPKGSKDLASPGMGEASLLGEAAASQGLSDFDIFQRFTSEQWGGEEEEKAAYTAAADDRTWAAARATDGGTSMERALCGFCRRRFAGVSCRECRQAYCLRCVIEGSDIVF